VIEPELIERAANPTIRVGRDLLAGTLAAMEEPWALVTQLEPRALLGAGVLARAAAVRDVESLAEGDLERLERGIPGDVGTIVGFGGGMALDAAKYVAWTRGARLILSPSILSVDAVVTNTVAVRRGGGIVYDGFVVADLIVLDTALVAQAPPHLNRAGVGDLVSIHTGLADWRRGAAAGRIAFDPAIASAAADVLDQVEALASEIGSVSDAGLAGVLRAYADVNVLCLRAGHSGPEEGSEHYFGYHLEHVTGRSFVHGQLIGLGTVLMATLQGNDPARPRRILAACRLDWRPDALGVEVGSVRETLVGLRDFVAVQGLPYSVIDEADLSPDAVDDLLDSVLSS
jgi:glycerol-1-phosphate dehydrogenase [NAD(P)+]